MRSGAVDVIVVDSVAALVPRAEIEGEMGDSHVGLQARLMSQALRKLTGAISKSRTTVVFINQIREKVGVMFGSPEVTPGGRALKFYSSIRMDIRRVESLKQGTEIVGNRTRVRIVKNKVAPPFKEAEFDIMYGYGISREGSILDVATNLGIVSRSGTWYSWGDIRLGQGRENAKAFLRENPEVAEELENRTGEAAGLPPVIRHAGERSGGGRRFLSRTSAEANSGGAAACCAAPDPRAGAELEDRLRHAGFSDPGIEETVDWCRRLGYVDDERIRPQAGWNIACSIRPAAGAAWRPSCGRRAGTRPWWSGCWRTCCRRSWRSGCATRRRRAGPRGWAGPARRRRAAAPGGVSGPPRVRLRKTVGTRR